MATPAPCYDVIVVGAGPAGLMGATCLTTFGLSVLHIDNRPEPTTAGRADGLQPRTIEVLRNIGGVKLNDQPGDLASGQGIFNGAGLAKRMVSQGVRVYEVAFWDPTPTDELARTSRAPSCPEFIDVVDNYTLLLHQGLIEHSFLDEIEARRRRLPANKLIPAAPGGVFRPYEFVTCQTLENPTTAPEYPVEAIVMHGETKESYTVRAKYLLGCDGARSLVRKAMAGGGEGDGEWAGKIRMEGGATDIIWGVLDARVETNFPDIKSKCMIHSRDAGSIMVIPRESGLCRFYVQLQQSDDGTSTHIERSAATQEICIERAKKIFAPFKLEFGYVDWFSVYQIGQRIASKYTLDHRIFLGGDATHTHSPKAGQGMNISMLDMYSLSWKLNLVEKGMADASILLPTYEHERKGIAEELLKFDAEYSRLFSGRSPATMLAGEEAHAKANGGVAVDAQRFIETFKKNAFFTSGCGAVYFENVLNALPNSALVAGFKKKGVFNPEGSKLIAGQRLPPGKLTRAVDANQVRIQQEIKMNGAFRIHVFAGDYTTSLPALKALDAFLSSPCSFLNVHRPLPAVASSIVDTTPSRAYIEKESRSNPFNPFFTFLTVFSTPHTQWDIESLPYNTRIYRDQIYSDDIFDKRLQECGTSHPIHVKYGVDVNKGSIIAVRPDGYVGAVVTLDGDGFEALNDYFAGFMTGTPQ